MMTQWDRAAHDLDAIRRRLEPDRIPDPVAREHVRLAVVVLGRAHNLLSGTCAYGRLTDDLDEVRAAVELLCDAINGCADKEPEAPDELTTPEAGQNARGATNPTAARPRDSHTTQGAHAADDLGVSYHRMNIKAKRALALARLRVVDLVHCPACGVRMPIRDLAGHRASPVRCTGAAQGVQGTGTPARSRSSNLGQHNATRKRAG